MTAHLINNIMYLTNLNSMIARYLRENSDLIQRLKPEIRAYIIHKYLSRTLPIKLKKNKINLKLKRIFNFKTNFLNKIFLPKIKLKIHL